MGGGLGLNIGKGSRDNNKGSHHLFHYPWMRNIMMFFSGKQITSKWVLRENNDPFRGDLWSNFPSKLGAWVATLKRWP